MSHYGKTYSLKDGTWDAYEKKPTAKLQGKYLKVNIPSSQSPCFFGNQRNGVYEFSRSSRRRLLIMSAKIEWTKNCNPLFVTVTYPDGYVDIDGAELKRHRDNIFDRLEYFLQTPLPIIWRVEWMPRLSGMYPGVHFPHMHFMVFTPRRVNGLSFRRMWADVIGYEGSPITQVKRCKKGNQACVYVAKYCAKMPQTSPSLVKGTYRGKGRHWGLRRPGLLSWAAEEDFGNLSADELWIFVRAAARVIRDYDPLNPRSLFLLGDKAMEAVKEFRETRLDNQEGGRLN